MLQDHYCVAATQHQISYNFAMSTSASQDGLLVVLVVVGIAWASGRKA